jgi:hypothetical protein
LSLGWRSLGELPRLPAPYFRDIYREALAQVSGSLIEWQLADRYPQVQLITGSTTLETDERLLADVGRERSAGGSGGAVDGARTTPFVASRFDGDKFKERQNLFDADVLAELHVVNSGHWKRFAIRTHALSAVGVTDSEEGALAGAGRVA